MVSYPVDFPSDICVNGLRIVQRNVVEGTQSNFSLVSKTYAWSGESWQIEGSIPLLDQIKGRSYMAFVAKLKGRFGTFLYSLPNVITTPQGSWGGTPLVNGINQSGNTLNIDGLPVNITNVAVAGDYINLGNHLHMVLENADSNASGETTLTIWPSLRESPADNSSVTYTNLKVLLRLSTDSPIDIDINKRYFCQFKALEVV